MPSERNPERIQLKAEGWVTPAGQGNGVRFEVLAITAGNGNGWEFSEEVLKASLPLWEGVSCYVDHAQWPGHSVRDLGGVFSQPRWSQEQGGILLDLKPLGPSAPLVERLGQEILRQGEPRPNLGFSADLWFIARPHASTHQAGGVVERITRVESLDLVVNPARGGAFVRALQSRGGVDAMNCAYTCAPPLPPWTGVRWSGAAHSPSDQISSIEIQKGGAMTDKNDGLKGDFGQTHLPPSPGGGGTGAEAAQESVQQVQQQLCQYLLESGLAASKLPLPMQEHLRQQFQGRVFQPQELNAAIEAGRELVSQLGGAAVVNGPRLQAMFSSEDQLQAAVDDLFGVPRQKGLENLKVARLSGIRELYLMLTGDDDLHGGYYPSRLRLATTADFTGLVKNALNKIVVNQWEQLGRAGYDWWQRVVTVEQFSSLQQITGTLIGTVGTLPPVAEGAEYTQLSVGDSPETASFVKYGGYIPLTLELIDRDETRKLRAYPRELANAGLRLISKLVAEIFTQNNGVGPTMADGGALFNTSAVTSAGGHANLRTGALSSAEWEAVSQAVYNQPMLIKNAAGLYGSGPKMAVNPRYLLVPRPLELTAKKILYPFWENAANIHSENLQRGEMGDVVTVPEWTDASDWAAACDPRIVPAIFVGTRFGIMPEIFIAGSELSPAVFMNDEHRLKVRHFIAVWANDFRPLHKNNVV